MSELFPDYIKFNQNEFINVPQSKRQLDSKSLLNTKSLQIKNSHLHLINFFDT